METYARITGWGKYLPSRVLTNDDLSKMLDTSDEWIRTRTGIRERRIAADDETASTMATPASRRALEVAGLSPEDLDLIIVATCTPDGIFPSCASLLQNALGATKAAAFDVNAACSGFVYALVTGCQFIQSGAYQNVLVVGSEVYSRIMDWEDRSTCVLFGDGAGAVVLQADDRPTGPMSFVLGSDGSFSNILYVPGPAGARTNHNGHYCLRMAGPEVFRAAVQIMSGSAKKVVSLAGLGISDVDLFIPHQANERLIAAASRALGLPSEKVFINVGRYGNTSAASIPIALCEAVEEDRVHDGDRLVMVGFGGGLSWGAVVLQWGIREDGGFAARVPIAQVNSLR